MISGAQINHGLRLASGASVVPIVNDWKNPKRIEQ